MDTHIWADALDFEPFIFTLDLKMCFTLQENKKNRVTYIKINFHNLAKNKSINCIEDYFERQSPKVVWKLTESEHGLYTQRCNSESAQISSVSVCDDRLRL